MDKPLAPVLMVITLVGICMLSMAMAAYKPEWMAAFQAKERQAVSKWLGANWERRIFDFSQRLAPPVQTPDRERRIAVTEFVPDQNAIRSLIRYLAYRGVVFMAVLIGLVPLLVAAVVDGMVEWRKRLDMHAMEQPRVYHMAKSGALALGFAPLGLLVTPFTISPAVMIGWGLMMAVVLRAVVQTAETHV